MCNVKSPMRLKVHCRIGSLESGIDADIGQVKVHCRIGSLES